jgi:hypothetical protein
MEGDVPPESGTPPRKAPVTFDCPPLAPAPPRDEVHDPRVRLLQLAQELMRSQNRRLVAEYLRLRRAV